ncbi:MAG: hypothetical protein ACR2Q3_09200 [Woeseiaceae bacterium]
MPKLNLLILVLLLVFTGVPVANGQNADPGMQSDSDVAKSRAMIREGQDAYIRENIRLTEAEAEQFWPLYREYRSDLLPVQDRYVTLMADYMRQYRTGVLTNAYAEDMLNSFFDIKNDLLRTRKKYIRKFKRIMPMLKVARFYQMENKFSADVDAQLALLIPLVESS